MPSTTSSHLCQVTPPAARQVGYLVSERLEAMRARLAVARASHADATAELERLEKKRNASAFAISIARRRQATALAELKAARRAQLRRI